VLVALQTEPRFGAVEANLEAVAERVATDVGRCDLLVLPELFSTGYSFRDRDEVRALAEPFPDGPTVRAARSWSRATGGIVVAGFAERDGERLYNAALVVAAGEPLGCYRKLHLFGFESEGFDPGDRPLAVHEHGGLRVGVMVCFDWIFPEAARTLALAGADVLAHPSNLVLPGLCQRAMPVRALENRVYTVTANRAGVEHRPPRPRLAFTGASQVADPRGEVLGTAPSEGPALVRARADVGLARCKKIASGNVLFGERRPSFYTGWSEQRP
jgi:predicted amidohydrolase